MADTKKIVLYDLTELIVYDVSENNDYLTVRFLDMSIDTLTALFKQEDKIKSIKFYVNEILEKTYEKYVKFVSASQYSLGSIDTDSDIQSIIIRKKTLEERVERLEELGGIE